MSAASPDEGSAKVAAEIEHMKSAVECEVENAMHAAKQTLRRARHAAEDASEEVVHQMKRHPVESVGVAFGVGLLAGLGLGLALFGKSKGLRKERSESHEREDDPGVSEV